MYIIIIFGGTKNSSVSSGGTDSHVRPSYHPGNIVCGGGGGWGAGGGGWMDGRGGSRTGGWDDSIKNSH